MTDGRPDPGDWWRTSIIDTEPGRIVIRGRPVEELIGTWTFAQVIWLMTTGEELAAPRARLLEAALVAAVETLMGLADAGVQHGIAGTGETDPNDPWQAFGA